MARQTFFISLELYQDPQIITFFTRLYMPSFILFLNQYLVNRLRMPYK